MAKNDTETTNDVTENGTDNKKSRKPRIPVRVETMAKFLDEIPEPVVLARGKDKDMTIFQEMVKYLDLGSDVHRDGRGRVLGINFTGSDSAKQKAGQVRAQLLSGNYPLPTGWEWEISAQPLVEKDENGNDKSVGSTLYFQTNKKLSKNAKGKVFTNDKIRTRKSKKDKDTENAESES